MLAFVDEAIAEIEDARLAETMRDRLAALARAPAGDDDGATGARRRDRRGWRDPRGAMARQVAAGLTRGAGAPPPDARLRAPLRREPAERAARGAGARHRRPGGGRDRRASLRLSRAGAAARLRRWRRSCISPPAASARAAASAAARAALFWSLLLVAPVAIALALVGVAVEVAAPALLPLARLARLCRAGLLALAVRGEPRRGRGLRGHPPGGGGRGRRPRDGRRA